MVYFVEEIFLSSITFVVYTKEILFDCKRKKVYMGFFFQITKKRGEETILNLKRFSFKYKTFFKI